MNDTYFLSCVKDKLDSNEIDYFKNLLGHITNYLPMKKHLMFSLHDILPLLQKDIECIQKEHEAKPNLKFGHKKRTDDIYFVDRPSREVVLTHLHNYVHYFTNIADQQGLIHINDIQQLRN